MDGPKTDLCVLNSVRFFPAERLHRKRIPSDQSN